MTSASSVAISSMPKQGSFKGQGELCCFFIFEAYTQMNTTETRTHRENLNSQMIIVRSTGLCFPKLWWLDISQHSSATCEVVPLYQKEQNHWQKGQMAICGDQIHAGLQAPSVSQVSVAHFKVLSALLSTPTLNFSSFLE